MSMRSHWPRNHIQSLVRNQIHSLVIDWCIHGAVHLCSLSKRRLAHVAYWSLNYKFILRHIWLMVQVVSDLQVTSHVHLLLQVLLTLVLHNLLAVVKRDELGVSQDSRLTWVLRKNLLSFNFNLNLWFIFFWDWHLLLQVNIGRVTAQSLGPILTNQVIVMNRNVAAKVARLTLVSLLIRLCLGLVISCNRIGVCDDWLLMQLIIQLPCLTVHGYTPIVKNRQIFWHDVVDVLIVVWLKLNLNPVFVPCFLVLHLTHFL